MKKVSRAVSVSVSGEVAASRKGIAKGAPVAARAPKATPKEPSESQYVAMAGAMANALERLRTFYQTLSRAKEVTANGGTGVPKIYQNYGAILLHPSESEALLGEVEAAANILRSGLKARTHRERL